MLPTHISEGMEWLTYVIWGIRHAVDLVLYREAASSTVPMMPASLLSQLSQVPARASLSATKQKELTVSRQLDRSQLKSKVHC